MKSRKLYQALEKTMATCSSVLAWKIHGRRSLVGCSPWGREESDTTERLHFRFSLSCIGEGNGNTGGVLAWRIPGTGEPGGLPSMGSHRVGHGWSDLAAAAAAAIWDNLNIKLSSVRIQESIMTINKQNNQEDKALSYSKIPTNMYRRSKVENHQANNWFS